MLRASATASACLRARHMARIVLLGKGCILIPQLRMAPFSGTPIEDARCSPAQVQQSLHSQAHSRLRCGHRALAGSLSQQQRAIRLASSQCLLACPHLTSHCKVSRQGDKSVQSSQRY